MNVGIKFLTIDIMFITLELSYFYDMYKSKIGVVLSICTINDYIL